MSNHSQPSSHFFAVTSLLYSAFIWGLIWYPYRLLAEQGVNGIQAGLITYGLALVIAMLLSLRCWRTLLTMPRGMLPLALTAGWTNIAYIIAVLEGEVVRVMLLFYLSPVWVLFLAHFWLKEPTTLKRLLAIVLALSGAFIMLMQLGYGTQWWHQLPLPHNAAEWWALSAGFAFALSNVISRAASELSLVHKSFAVWLGVVFVSATMLLILPGQSFDIPVFSDTSLGLSVLIALMLITATVSVQYGVTQLLATRAAVIFLFQLVVAAIAAYFLAGEVLRWNEWLGGGLILLASVLSSEDKVS